MSDKNDKTKWDRANKLIRKKSGISAEGSLVKGGSNLPILKEAEEPAGILAQYKSNKIKRGAALIALEESYRARLEVFKHEIKEAVRLKKAEVDVFAKQFLKDLDARQLEVLTEIGLRNSAVRDRALIDLTDQTVKALKEVQEKDWPEKFIDDTISNLVELRDRQMKEIMEELGKDDSL